MGLVLAMLLVGTGSQALADEASPKNTPATGDINQRLYEQLEGSPSASKIENPALRPSVRRSARMIFRPSW